MSGDDLIWLLIDVVSNNGNLLINVGPTGDGKIPEIQQSRLKHLGVWLKQYGESIFETTPWITSHARTQDGLDVRFTRKDSILYTFIHKSDIPSATITFPKFPLRGKIKSIENLGTRQILDWTLNGKVLAIHKAGSSEASPVTIFKIHLDT
jgi:alpha-L-fucosidase